MPLEKHDRSQLTVLRSHFAVQLFETVGTAGFEPATPWPPGIHPHLSYLARCQVSPGQAATGEQVL